MSFKPYTEKRKKLEFVRFWVGSVSRTRPGSGSIIQEADPRIRIRIRIKWYGSETLFKNNTNKLKKYRFLRKTIHIDRKF